MAKLSILGAQRVKALIEILNDKEKEAIREVESQVMTYDEAKKLAYKEFGIAGVASEITELKKKIEELSEELENATGYFVRVSTDYNYRDKNRDKFDRRVREIQRGESDKKISEIKADFRRREQQLWLCETLEEAKKIVGIE